MAKKIKYPKQKTCRVKHKGCPSLLMTSAEGYEPTRFFAKRMTHKTGFPLLSFKAVKQDKKGRFKR